MRCSAQLLARLLPICLLTLSSCTAFKSTEEAEKEAEKTHYESEQKLRQLTKDESRLRIHDEPWVEREPIQTPVERLPAAVNCELAFATGAPMQLNEFSKLVNRLCKVPVRLTPDAVTYLRAAAAAKGQPVASAQEVVVDRWQGNLAGLLDSVASSLGLSWRYSDRAVQLYHLDARSFTLYAIPSETKVESMVKSGTDVGVGEGTSGSGGSSKGDQHTSVSLASSITKDIQKSIEGMLTPKLGRISFSGSTGSITVIDTPENLDRIDCYVAEQNRLITKQVLLKIQVFAVELFKDDQFGIDWSFMLRGEGQAQSGLARAVGGAAMGWGGKLEAKPNDGLSLTVNSNSMVEQAKFILKELAKQGKVSLVTSPSVTTLNLQPVPVQVAQKRDYLARITSTESGVGFVKEKETKVETGTVTDGFSMSLLPFIMADNQLLLQYSISMSELLDLKAHKVREIELHLPRVNNRIFSQNVRLKSGETLLLSGFEQVKNEATREGLGSPGNWFFGGGVAGKSRRSVILLMITPTVLP